MHDHSLIAAGMRTYAKIALLALTAACVFLAVVNASGSATSSIGGSARGPVVKATSTVIVTRTDSSSVR